MAAAAVANMSLKHVPPPWLAAQVFDNLGRIGEGTYGVVSAGSSSGLGDPAVAESPSAQR